MKIEIYQVGKIPPLVVIECNGWRVTSDKVLEVIKENEIIAVFNFDNIAGLKELQEVADERTE